MKDTISGSVTHTVVLGKHGYGDDLTIAGTGIVLPSRAGADALIAPASLGNAERTFTTLAPMNLRGTVRRMTWFRVG